MVHEKRSVEIAVICSSIFISVRTTGGTSDPALIIDALLHHVPGIQTHPHSVIEVAKSKDIPGPAQSETVFTQIILHRIRLRIPKSIMTLAA